MGEFNITFRGRVEVEEGKEKGTFFVIRRGVGWRGGLSEKGLALSCMGRGV